MIVTSKQDDDKTPNQIEPLVPQSCYGNALGEELNERKNKIKLARSDALLSPTYAILVPLTYFLGLTINALSSS